MHTTAPGSQDPEEVRKALAELEHYANAGVVDADLIDDEGDELPFVIDLSEGETRRVRELRAQVAEAHHLAALQADQTPLQIDTKKVRKRRQRVAEAARLHALDQDPSVLAYRDQRVRRAVTWMVFGAAGIALGASSIGVQSSVSTALGLKEHSLGWWAAFLVEPALSLPLLGAVAVQAYSAIRGKVVDRTSPEGKRLFRTEAILLALTLILNCWPAFIGPDGEFKIDPLAVIVHALGPVAAVTAVWVLPTLWAVLAALPVEGVTPPLTGPLTGLTYRENAVPRAVRFTPSNATLLVDRLVAEARKLINDGELPPAPSANKIQKRFRCGMDIARAVRDRLAQDGDAS